MYNTVQVQFISCVCVCVHVLPLMQAYNVLDISENDLFLVEDINRDVVTGVQII